MFTITRQSTQDQVDAYWADVMKYRMPEQDEVTRLITALKGFYFEDEDGYENLTDFAKYAKRPWGNKNIEQSIMFNLGWDVQRVLCYKEEPRWVTEIAEDLYNKVISELENGTKWF